MINQSLGRLVDFFSLKTRNCPTSVSIANEPKMTVNIVTSVSLLMLEYDSFYDKKNKIGNEIEEKLHVYSFHTFLWFMRICWFSKESRDS